MTAPMTKEEFAEAVEGDYRAGYTFSEIAARTGRSRSAVAGKANRMGLKSRGAGRGPRSVSARSDALGARIAALHAEGLTSGEIGISLGMEIRAVRRRLNASGLTLTLNRSTPGSSPQRPTPPDPTPTSPAGALTYRAGPVDLTPPETSSWFADGKGCRFSCWPTTERDPFAKRCCGATATRGSYCDYHAPFVYAPDRKAA